MTYNPRLEQLLQTHYPDVWRSMRGSSLYSSYLAICEALNITPEKVNLSDDPNPVIERLADTIEAKLNERTQANTKS